MTGNRLRVVARLDSAGRNRRLPRARGRKRSTAAPARSLGGRLERVDRSGASTLTARARTTVAVATGLVLLLGGAARPAGAETAASIPRSATAPSPSQAADVRSALSPSFGPVGQAVLISGTGFADGDTVNFGATPSAQVTVWGSNTLTANAPPAPVGTVVGITVLTPNGPAPLAGSSQFRYVTGKFNSLAVRDNLGRLWAYPGDGDGSYRPRVLLGVGWNGMRSIVGMPNGFTGPGFPELLAQDTHGNLWRYSTTGHLFLYPRLRVGVGWSPMTALAGLRDITGDGYDDLAARDSSGRLWLYPGTGRGAFAPRRLVGRGGWNSMTAILGPGDFNGDGSGDLLARDTTGRLWLYPGDGVGGLRSRILIGIGWESMRNLDTPGDFDGDGEPDVLASNPTGQLVMLLGTGKGRLGARLIVGNGGWQEMTAITSLGASR